MLCRMKKKRNRNKCFPPAIQTHQPSAKVHYITYCSSEGYHPCCCPIMAWSANAQITPKFRTIKTPILTPTRVFCGFHCFPQITERFSPPATWLTSASGIFCEQMAFSWWNYCRTPLSCHDDSGESHQKAVTAATEQLHDTLEQTDRKKIINVRNLPSPASTDTRCAFHRGY